MKKNYTNEEYYITNKQILEKAKKIYGIRTWDPVIEEKNDANIIRTIQRFVEENIEVKAFSGRTHLYSLEQANIILEGCDKCFRKYAEDPIYDNSLKKIKTEEEYELMKKSYEEQWWDNQESIAHTYGLTLNEYVGLITWDNSIMKSSYLSIGELELLNRVGLTTYDELSKEELELIEANQEEIIISNEKRYQGFNKEEIFLAKEIRKEIEKEKEDELSIASLYKKTKLEVMIEALFFDKFELDEALLLADVTNQYNVKDTDPFSIAIDEVKSIDRLEDYSNYYENKLFSEKFELDYTLLIKDINNMILIDEEGIENADEQLLASFERLKNIKNYYILK